VAEQRNNPHRHRAAHARAPGRPLSPGAPARPGPADPGWAYPDTGQPGWAPGAGGADWPPPGTDYPSWPADADQYGWVPGADHPSWPAGAAGPDWPQPGTDYSSWPPGAGYDWSPDDGGASRPRPEPAVVQHHEQRWQTPVPVPAPRYEYPYPARPAGGAHTGTGRWSAQLARAQDTATQTYYELAFGDGRLQVMLTEPPAASQEWAAGVHTRPVAVLPAGAEQAAPAGWDTVDLHNADAVRVAERILSDADHQAAGIHREATAQATAIREAAEQEAAEIRQQAAAQAVPVREAAGQAAAEIRQQAAAQATAVRETAEREAAAIRAAAQRDAEALRSAVETMSAELGRMTSILDDTLTGLRTVPRGGTPRAGVPESTATAPAAPPRESEPAGSTAPADSPSPGGYAAPQGHGAKTAPPSALRKPPGKPGTQTRQQTAARRVAIGAASLVTFGLLLGAFNLFTYHSFSFFVFRGQGVGATPPSPLPAQPNGTPSPATHRHPVGSGHKLPEPKGRHHRRRAHDQSAHGGNHG
jgi:hypothetical protein